MLYAYIAVSAALIPILNNFFPILREGYSWWLIPLLFVGFFISFILIQALIVVTMIWCTSLEKNYDKSTKFFRFLINETLPIIVWVARVEIRSCGIEKIPEDGRVLLVCNHQHDFDPAVIVRMFPRAHLAFIGKKEIVTLMPFVARAMHRLQCLFIDRENDREAAKTIVKAIKLIKDDMASIALFPEGYVSKSCELLPFRNGSLKVALKTGVPVAVCVINNTRSIPKNIFRRKTVVDFRLLDVIYPEQYEGMNTIQLGDIIHEKMETALAEIRGNN